MVWGVWLGWVVWGVWGVGGVEVRRGWRGREFFFIYDFFGF